MGMFALLLAIILDPILSSTILPSIARYLPGTIGEQLVENPISITATLAFTLLYTGHNIFFWRLLSQFSKGEDLPDLQGVWIRSGVDAPLLIEDDYDEDLVGAIGAAPHLIISQSWTQMEIAYVDLDQEYWRSDTAAVLRGKAPNPELVCTFQSESYDDLSVDFDRGTMRVRYFESEESDRLVGYLYTDSSNSREKVVFERRHASFFPPHVEIEESSEVNVQTVPEAQ